VRNGKAAPKGDAKLEYETLLKRKRSGIQGKKLSTIHAKTLLKGD